jgi:hypothetical protein
MKRALACLMMSLALDLASSALAQPTASPARGDPAQTAYHDLITRFWSGDATSGHLERYAVPPRQPGEPAQAGVLCQALWERGVIGAGVRGLGFGVGREPLTAYFASEGCEVLATDLASDQAVEAGWAATDQHADSLEGLWRPHLCDRARFDRQVSFRVCDMNQVPDELTGFDFCWSACSLEHLGSIAHGLAFIERSLQCLKPGGWAVHTTEFNLSSDSHTVETGGTVLFRRQDMEALAERLTAQGHKVAPFDFDPGAGPLDRYVDVAPYRAEPHLKLALDGYATTSIGLIVQRLA